MAIFRALLLYMLLFDCIFAVTVIPLTLNLPKPYESSAAPSVNESDLFSKFHAGTGRSNEPIISNVWLLGHENSSAENNIYASHDSFIRGAVDASAKHQHLMIQPEDVWLTILKQLGSYMRRHKDDKEVSEKWDNYEGKQTLPDLFFPNLGTWTELQFLIRNKTNWLRDWVQPNFSTIGQESMGVGMMARALMMASSSLPPLSSPPSLLGEELASFPCKNGIPSITLIGTQADWRNLLGKLDRLGDFGKEPTQYSRILRPILSRFVTTFEKPNDTGIRLFWSDIVTATPRQKLCNTTDLVTGWINAFHYWDGAGNLVSNAGVSGEALQLDGITYSRRYSKDIPISYSHLGMCLAGDRAGYGSTETLLGMLAKSIKKGVPQDYAKALKLAGFRLPMSVVESDHSILRPFPVWMTYIADDHNTVLFCPLSTSSQDLSNKLF
jgi:hypothetical protein